MEESRGWHLGILNSGLRLTVPTKHFGFSTLQFIKGFHFCPLFKPRGSHFAQTLSRSVVMVQSE